MFFDPAAILPVLKELANNKLRSFLSLLGISIGIFCVISVLTVFDSLQENIQNNMRSLGSNILYVGKYPWIPEDKGEYPWWKYRSRPVCNYAEMKYLDRNLPGALRVCICFMDQAKVAYRDREVSSASLYAVSNGFDKMQSFDLAGGRYFATRELSDPGFHGVVIGGQLARDLFDHRNPIGQLLQMEGQQVKVIGVLAKQGRSITGFNYDEALICSYLFLAARKNIDNDPGNGFTDPMLMVETRRQSDVEDMVYEIRAQLRAFRKLKPREPDNFSINKLDAIQNSISSIFSQVRLFGWLIGIFSLVVGCFGIANIMYVSVRERTAQIGLKKALGARTRHILYDFLRESVILCMIGGLAGIVLVFILALILSIPLGFPVFLSVNNFLLGIFISLVVGIAAGYLPARKAAYMNPVEAIRS